ncbi:Sulfate/thiosulfate import ATP-binding protein CysA [Variovorax sp. PBS-H4]|uniref:ABC transporter ATP-binding protein n=1 Tax=Variovorax sp. PBS-H4 TaxID=434008 RepID=UPI0013193422|nr:ABC transporter ATP-binding protein [Variovorax sp. PBS-H4]VTU25487.1 Sulfate/thiosulfate import ATP-binding protein CysA [Variovorax sp. PBS-H4]
MIVQTATAKSTAQPLLRGQGLTRRFGGLVAVSGLDIEIHDREILGLIGPNGAGKSTTFNLISGFYKPSTGRLFLHGEDMTGASPERISRKAGLVRTFQHGSLMPSMSVRDNLFVGAIGALPAASRAVRERRVRETAELLGLQSRLDERAGQLPHGLQRLVSIAIAFAVRPRLLCLDEPLTGLNQTEVGSILEVFCRIRDEFGCSILLVEHNMKAVMSVCDRLVVLHHGQLLATGTPAQVGVDAKVVAAYLGGAHAQ